MDLETSRPGSPTLGNWPEDTPVEAVGMHYTVNLATGKIRATYHSEADRNLLLRKRVECR
jgi:hypothetical protein